MNYQTNMHKSFRSLLLLGIIVSHTICSQSQNFWQQLNTPDAVQIFDVEVNDTGHIFLASGNQPWGTGGVYRSLDNANSWEKVGLADRIVYSLHIDQFGHIYAGGGNWICKSLDNGNSWDTLYHPYSNVVVIKHGFDSVVLAGGFTEYAIMRSGDYGATWDTVLSLPPSNPMHTERIKDFLFSENGVIFAGCHDNFGVNSGVYKSTDYGITWDFFGLPVISIFSLAFDTGGDLLAGTLATGIYRYDFTTGNWNLLENYLSVEEIIVNQYNDIYLACSQFPYSLGGVKVSYDNGQTFEYINSGLNEYDINDFAIDPNGHLLASNYTPGELYISFDPITHSNSDQFSNHPSSLRCVPNPTNDIACVHFDNYNSKSLSCKINLYTLDGKLIESFSGIERFPYQLNMFGKPAGVYIVQLIFCNNIIVSKIIKY